MKAPERLFVVEEERGGKMKETVVAGREGREELDAGTGTRHKEEGEREAQSLN